MSQCPQCHQQLAAGAPGGLCPACLLRQGLTADVAVTTGPESMDPSPLHSQIDSPPVLSPPQLETLLPQFDQIELLGRGGMGVVYKARQKNLDRFVALKVLSPHVAAAAGFSERFAREARAMARLNHPNIVAVYDFGCFRDGNAELCYFTMEYVDGSNLRGLLKSLAPAQALGIVPQICEALQYAHDIGIVHRDIKPENILVDKKGRVKIADFGLAKLLQRTRSVADYTLTRPDLAMGTPSYMAPEQLERPTEVDHRADLYSLGVVFYEMLTGQLPQGRFPLPSQKVHIDVRLDEVVLKALEYDRELRYQHASEVRTSLELVSSSQGALALGPAAGSQTPARSDGGSMLPAPKLSRLALAGFICNFLAMFGAMNIGMGAASLEPVRDVHGTHLGPGWAITQMATGALVLTFLAAIGALLGAMSLKRIRRSPATFYGLRLALFDLLQYPLLLLDVALSILLLFLFATVVATPVSDPGALPASPAPTFSRIIVFAVIPLMLFLNVLIYWRIWLKLRVAPAPIPASKHLTAPVTIQRDPSAAPTANVISSSATTRESWRFYAGIFLLYCLCWILSIVTWNLKWPGFIFSVACFTGISWWQCRRILDRRPQLLAAQRCEKSFKRFYRRYIGGPTFASAFFLILLAMGLTADGPGFPDYATVFRPSGDLADANRIVLKDFQAAHPDELTADVRDLTYATEFGRFAGTWIGRRPDGLLLRSAPMLGDNFSGLQLARTWVNPSPNPPEFRALPYFWIYMVLGLVLFIGGALDLLGSKGFLFSGLVWKPALRLAAMLLASLVLVWFWNQIIASWVYTSRMKDEVLTMSSEFATLDEHGNSTAKLFPALDQWAGDHGYEIAALTSGKLLDFHRFPVKATPVTYQAAILWKPGLFDRVRRSWEGVYSPAPELLIQSAGTASNSLISIMVFSSSLKAENDAGNTLQKDLHESLKHDLATAPQSQPATQPSATQPGNSARSEQH